MAILKKVVKPVAKVAPQGGFQVVSMDTIEFLPGGGGGGKPMDPAVQRLIEKALTLQIGQGIKIPAALRVQRNITGANGVTSELHTYKGAQSLSKRSNGSGIRFRTRRDTANNLWLFAVEPYTDEQVANREAKKAAKTA